MPTLDDLIDTAQHFLKELNDKCVRLELENRRRWSMAGRKVGGIFPRLHDVGSQYGPLRTTSGLIIG